MTIKKTIYTNPSIRNDFNDKRRSSTNKAISAAYAKRNHLLRELKDVDTLLFQLLDQLNLDEEYKKLTRI